MTVKAEKWCGVKSGLLIHCSPLSEGETVNPVIFLGHNFPAFQKRYSTHYCRILTPDRVGLLIVNFDAIPLGPQSRPHRATPQNQRQPPP